MTRHVQTSSEETRPRSSSPLIFSRDSFSTWTKDRFQTGGAQPTLADIFIYMFFLISCFHHLTCLCNIFIVSASVGYWSSAFIRRIIYKFFNMCPFDYTAFAVGGKVGIPLTGLTTPVGWLSLPQLTVLSRSAIVV